MQNILIIGAGRSATALINYLLSASETHGWKVSVADNNIDLAKEKVGSHVNGKAIALDIYNKEVRQKCVQENDVVISMLPAFMHIMVAKECLKFSKHLITASYVSDEIYAMHDEAKEKGILFMGEIGLDPGIDHMSAMEKIDEIKSKGGVIKTFRSYTGGIIAEESDNNPWHYKFTWNPRNVVLAGQSTAKFLVDGQYTYTPYRRLFKNFEIVDIKGIGNFEMYPNRDSLDYQETYGLQDTPNLIRGTLRHQGYCEAWNAVIKIGLTDDTYKIEDSKDLTIIQFVNSLLHGEKGMSTKEKVASLIHQKLDGTVMDQLTWIGLFTDEKIQLDNASPAQILQDILMKKWTLDPEDKDWIIMQHEFEYNLDGEDKKLYSTMNMKGDNATDTAMSRLVGLPLAIFAKQLMLGNVNLTGVQIPVMKEVYHPVLEELKSFEVEFEETELVAV